MNRLIFCMLICSGQTVAQTNAPCDTGSWSLVFEDDFNGTQLNRSHWHTYGNWAGMESDNWGQSRSTLSLPVIFKDENVEVRDGICRLKVIHEDATWKCDTCQLQLEKRYSSGELFSYYTRPYRYGRFEARIQFPVFRWAHGCFWLWPGTAADGSAGNYPEIDIAESYGDPFFPTPFASYNNRFIDYSIHHWGPAGHREYMNRYPRQHWSNKLRGDYFDMQNWHTYTCEWDPGKISFYLDGALLRSVYKYYYLEKGRAGKRKVYTACEQNGKIMMINPEFPPDNWGSNLRLTLAIDKAADNPPGLIGEMLIDYVRVWERK